VRWHQGGSIILPSVFAYFLGNAKSMSLPGLRAKEIGNLRLSCRHFIAKENQSLEAFTLIGLNKKSRIDCWSGDVWRPTITQNALTF